MKTLRSLLMVMALLMAMAIPVMAQDGSEGDTVTKTFKLTVNSVEESSNQVFAVFYGTPEQIETGPDLIVQFCGPEIPSTDSDKVTDRVSEDDCRGGGTVYTSELEFPRDTQLAYRYVTGTGETIAQSFDGAVPERDDPDDFETLNQDTTNSVTYPAGRQDGGDKVPDNQQGGGDTVTKTFELTLNGTVPEGGEAFQVSYSTGGEAIGLVLCSGEAGATTPLCEGGETYSVSVDFPAGTTIEFAFERFNVGVFHEGTETINEDMSNTAWYTFGKGTGAGDDKQTPDNQQDGEDKDAGAGDEQETPDNQQDDTQDDQQGEMPEEMPETGAGALAPGAAIPVGNAAAGLAMLVGVGTAVLRRR